MIWNKESILTALAKLHKRGTDISYNSLSKKNQSLVSAAAYHFGSYRKAVEEAGVDYAEVSRRPRWTRQLIITMIKQARAKNKDLHWSAVTKRRDELGHAAFASLQPRLFGSWNRALSAAGLDADDVSRYRSWSRSAVVSDLKERKSSGDAMNSGALQQDDPGLHAAAVRHFGSYEKALTAAKIDAQAIRKRRSWTKPQIVTELKALKKKKIAITDTNLRRENPALYGAALRLYGSFSAARNAAGVK